MTDWLDDEQQAAWVRLIAMVELLPGVLDTQLRREADLTHFEYFLLAMLSEAPQRTLRMTALAVRTNATLPRLSHVVRRLEDRGLVERFPCPADRRATNARLTGTGWETVVGTAAGSAAAAEPLLQDPLLYQAAIAVPGGRLLSTALLNILVTDDGRIFAGMVPPEGLQAAAAAR